MMRLRLLAGGRGEKKWSVWLKEEESALSLLEAMNLKWAVGEECFFFPLNVGQDPKDERIYDSMVHS